jgi:hypothetical protein
MQLGFWPLVSPSAAFLRVLRPKFQPVGNSDLAKCAAFVLQLPDGLQGDLRLAQRMAAQLGGQLSHHALIST